MKERGTEKKTSLSIERRSHPDELGKVEEHPEDAKEADGEALADEGGEGVVVGAPEEEFKLVVVQEDSPPPVVQETESPSKTMAAPPANMLGNRQASGNMYGLLLMKSMNSEKSDLVLQNTPVSNNMLDESIVVTLTVN